MSNVQLFKIAETAKFFGNVSTSWIREKEARGLFRYEDGTIIEPLRDHKPRYKNYGDRRYNLKIIYEMAQSLYREGIITELHRDAILDVLVALRRTWKYPKRKSEQ